MPGNFDQPDTQTEPCPQELTAGMQVCCLTVNMHVNLYHPIYIRWCGDLGINSKTPNRILTRRLPDTKCINASPRIRLHASIRLKSEKRKIIKSNVANGKWLRQN